MVNFRSTSCVEQWGNSLFILILSAQCWWFVTNCCAFYVVCIHTHFTNPWWFTKVCFTQGEHKSFNGPKSHSEKSHLAQQRGKYGPWLQASFPLKISTHNWTCYKKKEASVMSKKFHCQAFHSFSKVTWSILHLQEFLWQVCLKLLFLGKLYFVTY